MKLITTVKLKKSTVGLLSKLKIHPRQPYEEVIINLIEGQKKDRKLGKKGDINTTTARYFIAVISILSLVLLWQRSGIFGFVAQMPVEYYEDILNLEIDKDTVYNWTPQNHGILKSIKLSGSLKENGTAKVWVEKDNRRFLIFDYELLKSKKSDAGNAAGYAISDRNKVSVELKNSRMRVSSDIASEANSSSHANSLTTDEFLSKEEDKTGEEKKDKDEKNKQEEVNQTETIINTTAANETQENAAKTIENTTAANETQENAAKTIEISLEYNKYSLYDEDNNGEESVNGIVDLSVNGTKFNWDADKPKLCTKWETYSEDEGRATTVCYKNNECCNFIGFVPLRANWNEAYYAAFNQYGAGLNNIISAQVVYYDVNLSLENPKAEILNSGWGNLTAKFHYGSIDFGNICAETCLMAGIDEASYTLVFEVENTKLKIDKIVYSMQEKARNDAPLLIENVSAISIIKNQNATLNLRQYFYDEDELIYAYGEAENVTILFDKGIATIRPGKDFTGVVYTYFLANDKDKITVSTVFSINVTEPAKMKSAEIGAIQLQAKINEPVKWRKRVKIENRENAGISIIAGILNASVKKISPITEALIDKSKIKIRVEGAIRDLKVYELEEKQTAKSLNETAELIINEAIESIFEELEANYETEAPKVFEEDLSEFNKIITISSELPYENVLAYTTIKDAPQPLVKLYWIKNGAKELFTNVSYYDENNNSLIDRLEWVVPHLSNQTFEVVIEISKAMHLDENRIFISDIYNQAYALDDTWSEPIYENEFVRVAFKQALDATRDITIYARNNQSLNTYVEVYHFNSTSKITEFPLIAETRYYKVFLTGMIGSHDTFDLRIVNTDAATAFLEFDHIIDPALPAGFCHGGDLATTCWINTTHYVNSTDNILSANNVIINASGQLVNSTGIIFTINLTGNLIMDAGSVINLSGASCGAGTCGSGGVLLIAAQAVTINGTILADGGVNTGTSTASGNGGNITINASTLYVGANSQISASSDYVMDTANQIGGGDAGTININATLVNISGTINARGGNGDKDNCPPDAAQGTRGNGWTVNITAVTIANTGLINVEKGSIGFCDAPTGALSSGRGGQIWINNTWSPCNNGTIFGWTAGTSAGQIGTSCQITKWHRIPANYVWDLSGKNLTLGNGARLNGDSDDCSGSVSCQSGDSFTILVDVLNLSEGNISSDGGSYLGTQGVSSGNGGIITINASVIYVEANSQISASSDYVMNKANQMGGGDAGTININATLVNISGTINARGGNGDNDNCPGGAQGTRGNGGTVNITAVTIANTGLINVEKGSIGFCDSVTGGLASGRDGQIWINNTWSPCNN